MNLEKSALLEILTKKFFWTYSEPELTKNVVVKTVSERFTQPVDMSKVFE